MQENINNRWLEILSFIFNLIRPKFHNSITKVVVIFGLTLSVESQVNIIEAFAVAIFEYFFGPSEVLRSLFAGNTNPWIGVFFVVFGLIYNALYSIGLEYVKVGEFKQTKKPKLSFFLLNSDNQKLEKETNLRGKLCTTPKKDDIPDNNSYSEFALKKIEKRNGSFTLGRFSGTSIPVTAFEIGPFDEKINKDFYRERAKFLKTWGGAEILTLSIENTGEVLCKNIKVEINFPKKAGIDADNIINLAPDLPSQETESRLEILSSNSSPPDYDIKRTTSTGEYIFYWYVGDLQTGYNQTSKTKIFLRTNESFVLKVRIYCDELSNPLNSSYILNPPTECIDVTLNEILSENEIFSNIVSEIVMDGYLDRFYDNLRSEMEHDHNSHLPG